MKVQSFVGAVCSANTTVVGCCSIVKSDSTFRAIIDTEQHDFS